MRRRYFGAIVIVAMVLFTFAVWAGCRTGFRSTGTRVVGLVTIVVALRSPQRGFARMFAALVLAALVPLVYSYMAWRGNGKALETAGRLEARISSPQRGEVGRGVVAARSLRVVAGGRCARAGWLYAGAAAGAR